VAGHRRSGGYSPVPGAAVREPPRVQQRYGIRWSYGCSACVSVFVLVVEMYSCLKYTSYSDRLLAAANSGPTNRDKLSEEVQEAPDNSQII
jgi:hypothetical protein